MALLPVCSASLTSSLFLTDSSFTYSSLATLFPGIEPISGEDLNRALPKVSSDFELEDLT